MIDVMGQVPMYPGFAAGFMPNFSNYMDWKEDPVCPNCGKASSWKTIINNNN